MLTNAMQLRRVTLCDRANFCSGAHGVRAVGLAAAAGAATGTFNLSTAFSDLGDLITKTT
jgi:hypothetical protein